MSAERHYARLLDAWTPPPDAGDPVGCLATSFTFDAAFFEEECLGRFVRMETDPDEDGALFLLEREEKLAELDYAGCIVDAHHCRGTRSLRWDLLRAHVPRGGVMHAKVAVLAWTRLVRIIFASANLTKNGYRKNIEVFGAVDFADGGDAAPEALENTLEFLTAGLLPTVHADAAAVDRLRNFLAGVRRRVEGWSTRPDSTFQALPVFVVPGRPDLITQVATLPAGAKRYDFAEVVSPFYDRNAETYRPSERLWADLMRLRGDAAVNFHVPADARLPDKPICLHAPRSLLGTLPKNRAGCTARAAAIIPDDENPRDLHAKGLWLESTDRMVYLLGSSNFTSAGYGLGTTVNIEANLAYCLRRGHGAKFERDLRGAFPAGVSLRATEEVQWLPSDPAGVDEPEEGAAALPLAFKEAVYDCRDGRASVRFTLVDPPAGWQVLDEVEGRVVLDQQRVQMDGLNGSITLDWLHPRPPTGFTVRWDGTRAEAWWAVSVASGASLPPPEELRDLPLDVLLDILTSARPLHRSTALQRYLARRQEAAGNGAHDSRVDIDPHRNVDTSTFLLQRTRRVGWGLAALRERLERPFANAQCLAWRLHGPVGAHSVAQAICREAHSEEEKAFLIAELMLELHRVVPKEAPGALPAVAVREELTQLASGLRGLIPPHFLTRSTNSPMARYLRRVIRSQST
jgi:hypothetical protein